MSPKEKLAILILTIQATACVVRVLSPVTSAGVFTFIFSFPYALIAYGLRALSLPGGVGNVVAVVLYVFICLMPMGFLAFIRNKKPEDIMLPLISVVLFFVLYYMINPGLMPMSIGVAEIEGAVLGGIVHSLILAYAVIRILRLCVTATPQRLGRYMAVMLHFLNMLFVFMIFGVIFSQMRESFSVLGDGNTSGVTYVFLALGYVVGAVSYAFNIAVVFAALGLLRSFREDRYSDETLCAAKQVSKICVISLGVTVILSAGFNLLQLVFIRRLLMVNSNLNLPVASVLFVLGALLMTRYIAENKQLKDENDQFV